MSKEIDWSKAPEGATHWVGGIEPWHKHINGVSWYWQERESKWRQLSIPAEQVEDEYRDTIVERPPESWNGTGLPPVGIDCEYLDSDGRWIKCEVVAHRNNAAVILDIHYECALVPSCELRAIRTPEQIAAEEREKAVAEMMRDMGANGVYIERLAMERMFDAGYRKTEVVK